MTNVPTLFAGFRLTPVDYIRRRVEGLRMVFGSSAG